MMKVIMTLTVRFTMMVSGNRLEHFMIYHADIMLMLC